MPNKPKTPVRTFRISDADWLAAQAVAEERGEDLTRVIREELRLYVERHQKKHDNQDGSQGAA